MDILGIGPVELLLIFVMALIIFGPAKLPELGVALARAIREFQRASSEVTTEINRQLEEAENRRIMEQHPNLPVEASTDTPEAVAPIPAAVSSEAPHLEPIPSLEPAETAVTPTVADPEPAAFAVSNNGQTTDGHAEETSLASAEVVARPAEVTPLPAQDGSGPPQTDWASPTEEVVTITASTDAVSTDAVLTEALPAAEAPTQALVERAQDVEPAESMPVVAPGDAPVGADDQPATAETTKRRYRARQGRKHVGQSSPTDG